MIRALRRICKRAFFAMRMIQYDIFFGKRDGLVAISGGISYGTQTRVRLGKRVFLGSNGVFQGPGEIRIGERTYVGNFFSFNSREKITIGESCMLGNFVSIVDNNHGTDPASDMIGQPFSKSPVLVERNCWLGEKVTVLAGVHIGEGSVVAAGSVVTKDVPANHIVAGVPAKVVRARGPNLRTA